MRRPAYTTGRPFSPPLAAARIEGARGLRAQGLSYRKIAEALNMAEGTVAKYTRDVVPTRPPLPRTRDVTWKRDRAVEGKNAVQRCVSAPAEMWARYERAAQELGMSMSHFLRTAADAMIDNNPELKK